MPFHPFIFFSLFAVLIRRLQATGITYSSETFDIFLLLQCATSHQRNAAWEALICVRRAAETKGRAGSDKTPEESKCDEEPRALIIEWMPLVESTVTSAVELLWKKQKNLLAKKHLAVKKKQ